MNEKDEGARFVVPSAVRGVLAEVAKERVAQEAKWGEQNHDPAMYQLILSEEVGELAKAALHTRYGGPEGGIENMRMEAIQCAAVSVAIAECIDRAKWRWGAHSQGAVGEEGAAEVARLKGVLERERKDFLEVERAINSEREEHDVAMAKLAAMTESHAKASGDVDRLRGQLETERGLHAESVERVLELEATLVESLSGPSAEGIADGGPGHRETVEEAEHCRKCGCYLIYGARQRGDGLCGPCSRKANGKQTPADKAREEPELVGLEVLALDVSIALGLGRASTQSRAVAETLVALVKAARA